MLEGWRARGLEGWRAGGLEVRGLRSTGLKGSRVVDSEKYSVEVE